MTAPTLTITDRITAGAAWLDEHRPGWWQRIDLDTLDLSEPCYCVLGQEFAAEVDTDSQHRQTGYQVAELFWIDEATWKLGFSGSIPLDDGDEQWWDHLTGAWRELILARRAGTETTR